MENEPILAEAERTIGQLPPAADPETTKRNQMELTKIIEKLKATFNQWLDTEMDKAEKAMESMTVEQQEGVVEFWRAVSQFLPELIKWIGRVFKKLLEELRSGRRLDREASKKFFQSIKDFFDSLDVESILERPASLQDQHPAKEESDKNKKT